MDATFCPNCGNSRIGSFRYPGLAIFVPFTIGPIVGAILGQRIVLALLAR